MRFSTTYSRPILTPLGQRLLILSERKLYDLDAPIGTRESGTTLLRTILVQQTVRAAWDAVDQGRQGGLNDWSSPTAMGLDVLGEEDEEEAESLAEKEDRWFEDLLSDLGEEEEPPAYVYSLSASSSTPSYTLSPAVATVQVLSADTTPSAFEAALGPTSHIEYILPSLDLSPPCSLPITPTDETTNPDLLPLDELDEYDDLVLPPLMRRSWSSDSSDSDECPTPRLDSAELEDVTGGYDWKWGGGEVEAEEDEWDMGMLGRTSGGVRLRGL
ncbi:uncharacterized protein MKK02DRAFT_40880 [Dioszegia hungarica]|uniref:Uncharacterized protein n=1 Tax=Dioszegia hungarica TaxID=4972 RepID=A0AA38H4N7_9TREE|nr:uncharacterized protein MKK02DRAFT_40880 [Dioszegia hungarica]KAI9632576.1 hypothetical protein MKK02DRAFT_40880 [Dioszegia hungarica]